MAWEAVSQVEVAKIAGARPSDLQDLWYNMAVDIIAEKANRWNIATTTSVTDVVDGNGMSRIAVRRPPILSDRKSTRLNSSHIPLSRMPSSA